MMFEDLPENDQILSDLRKTNPFVLISFEHI